MLGGGLDGPLRGLPLEFDCAGSAGTIRLGGRFGRGAQPPSEDYGPPRMSVRGRCGPGGIVRQSLVPGLHATRGGA